MEEETPDRIRDLIDYLKVSPSPYHAVLETCRRLESAGFRRLDEREDWALSLGDRGYVVRGDSSIIAFRIGSHPPVEKGFRIIGAHTDSPNLRLKPHPLTGKGGYGCFAVEVYGGVLLHTWLDRDLGLAGRVIVRTPDGHLRAQFLHIDKPLARVSSLAIHLNREVNEKGLILNRQEHLPPLFMMGSQEEAEAEWHRIIGDACRVDPRDVMGFDLGFFDITPPSTIGAGHCFVASGRIDNLASCHAALCALLDADARCAATHVIALFDHEEVGSGSAQGAAGSFLEDVLSRLARIESARGDLARAIASSFLLSADMSHALHPNYADKHEPGHMPLLNGGPVIKTNVQQRYTTDGHGAALFRAWCRDVDVPFQDFVIRTDLGCGSTIGPITATRLGIHAIDVGNPMLSMHSAREICGARDIDGMIRVMKRMLESEDIEVNRG